MLAIVCPGQGSQTSGFLAPWRELPSAEAALIAASDAAQVDLIAHGTTSDVETIKDTAVAQPLIVAAGIAAFRALLGESHDDAAGDEGTSCPVTPGIAGVAGHSVGEITAAVIAGVLDDADAMVLVRERGRAMASASAIRPTGMSAVVGGDPDEVAAALARHGLTPANMNGAGQVVAAGTMEQLAALAQDAPKKSRVIPLSVAGAFHTEHMRPAIDVLAECARSVTPHAPWVTLLSNRDGQPVRDGADALARIVDQVGRPVRWDLVMESLVGIGVSALIELPPAGTLVGLAKRAMPGVKTLALKSPDDLDAARALLAEHGLAAGAGVATHGRTVQA